MATMEKRVLENLEKAGWHLKPSAIADLLQDIREDEETARMNERDLEKRLRSDLLDTDLCAIGARYLPDAQALLHLHTLQTPCILQVPNFISSLLFSSLLFSLLIFLHKLKQNFYQTCPAVR
jgi:hypothetical protein